MRENISELTIKGFGAEEVATTKYTNKDGASFIITGDSTAKEQNEKGFEGRLLELKNVYDSASDFDFITILNLEDEYKSVTKRTPEHTTRRIEILNMRRKLIDRLIHKNL